MPGKTFPGTGGFGPWFVPADQLGDVTQLSLETRVNGEVRQSASLADLVFDIPFLIEYVSTFTPVSPGDVIVTGTPGGGSSPIPRHRLRSRPGSPAVATVELLLFSLLAFRANNGSSQRGERYGVAFW